MNKSKLIWKNLSRINWLTVLGLLGLLIVVSQNAAVNAQPRSATKPSGKLDRIWVDYDVTEGGRKGMRIHSKFTVYGMKNVPSYLAIYFETSDGKRLRDNNKSFYSTSGEVAVYKELSIGYDPGVYNDLAIFMPYDELDLSPGEYDLRMAVQLIYKAGGLIEHLGYENFVFTQPATPGGVIEAPLPPSDNTPTNQKASVEKVWVEYDVTENGKRGMRIHVNFTVRGLKGVESYLAIYFERKNGEKLMGVNPVYSDIKNGQLAVFKGLKPGYEPTVYEDAQLFLPYEEIKIGKGVHDMRMVIDLIYKNGDHFAHIGSEEFVFRRQQ
ncbi:MAG: hypothetical protein M3384_21860 [Acidobacteriota bacterium]|nr:hypothetical protein [Acidobacteriota bacterium]